MAHPAAPDPESIFVSRKLVMYPDLNAHGRLFGGQLMSWIDEGLAQVAARMMGTSNIVTKKFGEIVFSAPGRLGDSVEIWCKVIHEGRTSLALEALVLGCTLGSSQQETRELCRSDVVYVALDQRGRPAPWKKPTG